MGFTKVTVRVENPADPARGAEIERNWDSWWTR